MVAVKKVFEDMSDEEKLEEAKRILDAAKKLIEINKLMDSGLDTMDSVGKYRHAGTAKRLGDKLNGLLDDIEQCDGLLIMESELDKQLER